MEIKKHIWVPWDRMTDQEKFDHEYAYIQYGYLKSISIEDAWSKAADSDIELLKALPNYSCDVFSEITGIIDDRLK